MLDGEYKWWPSGMTKSETLEGEIFFARVVHGGKDISTINAGLSVSWGVYAPVAGGGMKDCRAKGEIKFTGWASVTEELKLAKRIAKSTLKALERVTK